MFFSLITINQPNVQTLSRVVCVMSGGNIDAKVLARSLERAMAAEGRLVKFKILIADRPGSTAELCSLLSGIGVTLRDFVPERSWVKGDVFSVQVGHIYVLPLRANLKKKLRSTCCRDYVLFFCQLMGKKLIIEIQT